jgi:glycosyltransferase involved in cell wall biosynthesis
MLVASGVAVQLISCSSHEYDSRLADEVRAGAVRIMHSSLSIRESGPRSFSAWRGLLVALPRGVVVLPKPWHPMGSLMLHWLLRRHSNLFIVIEHLEADPLSFRFLRNPLNVLRRRTWILLFRLIDRNLSARITTKVVAVSQLVERRLLDDWRYPTNRVVTIRNGIHWQSFARKPETCAAQRAARGLNGDAFVFGMLARLSHDKGIDVAIDAMHRLVAQDPQTRAVLVIAGQGAARAELEGQVARLGLGVHVRFLGFIDDSSTLVGAFDSIVFASRREGLPLGLLEGMAAGCVPIVTRVSGMPEVVTDPSVGWVVPPEDATALATAMREVLDLEPELLESFRHRAAAQVREHFDAKTSYQRLGELIGVAPDV